VGLSLSEKARKCKGLYDAVNSGAAVEGMILGTRLPELKILTSGRPHGYFEAVQPGIDGAAAMRRVVDELRGRKQFDVVLIDTPAGLQGITGDVLRMADSVLIPQQAEPLGMRSIPQVLHAIQSLRAAGSPLEVAGILMTMVQNEQRESTDVIRELRALLPARLLLDTLIPRDPVFIKASAVGVPVGLLYQQPPAVAHSFDQLAAELEPRLRLERARPRTPRVARVARGRRRGRCSSAHSQRHVRRTADISDLPRAGRCRRSCRSSQASRSPQASQPPPAPRRRR
jgi:chromosome partitioning protein